MTGASRILPALIGGCHHEVSLLLQQVFLELRCFYFFLVISKQVRCGLVCRIGVDRLRNRCSLIIIKFRG